MENDAIWSDSNSPLSWQVILMPYYSSCYLLWHYIICFTIKSYTKYTNT